MLKYTFPGGVHPPHSKGLTSGLQISYAPIPKKLVVPLLQSIGKPARLVVNVGDIVQEGQLIGEADGFISSRVHAPVSGKVSSIAKSINPVYGKTDCVFIEREAEKGPDIESDKEARFDTVSREDILTRVKEAGIVGLGGAAFPTHVKLVATEKQPVDALIINGAECEPYLTCDFRLMVEKAKEIVEGIALLDKVICSKKIIVVIEDNKPEAFEKMEVALNECGLAYLIAKTNVIFMHAKYPQGGEKQIIKAVLKREVPPLKLPLEVGCMVQNVGTAYAIREAVYQKKPLIERCITLTGSCLKTPGNLIVRIGTMLSDIVQNCCGGFIKEPAKIILGGPMMGIAQYSLDIPIIKGVSGVVFLSKEEVECVEESPCIKCAGCVDVCPVNLMPTYIMRTVKKNNIDELKALNVADCIECGACAYECPARIPLVQYIKLAKGKLRNAK